MFTSGDAFAMYSQLKPTIEQLARIGVSHNDVNDGNIMVDKDGRYFLVDYGFASRFDGHLPENRSIIGTWCYYSPQLYRLNEYLAKCPHANASCPVVQQLVLDGNLYSLQSMMLNQLLQNEPEFESFDKRLLKRRYDVVEKDWRRFRKHPDRFMLIRHSLQMMWSQRKALIPQYMERHPEHQHLLKSLLSKCMIAIDDGKRIERPPQVFFSLCVVS